MPSHEVAIIGAGGYSGRELLRLLKHHPFLEVAHITSDRYAGKALCEVFPDFTETSLHFCQHEEALPADIPVFLAVPDETSFAKVPALLEAGHKVVDLSGAFRLSFRKEGKEEGRKGKENPKASWAEKRLFSVYGLPELFRKEIAKAKFIANPGCYPTSVILALAALGELRNDLASVTIVSSSGVSGAGGRVENAAFAFQEVYENFRAYKILRHQHEPEIIKYAADGLKDNFSCPVVFTPQLLPIYRGILSTITLHWNTEAPSGLENIFFDLAKKEKFLRFYSDPEEVQIKKTQYTNYLDMALRSRDNSTVIVTALDNLVKGAAGQAIQNMNLMLQLEESIGLVS